jgi:hypothetical protein
VPRVALLVPLAGARQTNGGDAVVPERLAVGLTLDQDDVALAACLVEPVESVEQRL